MKRNSPCNTAPKLTARGVRIVTATVFALVTVAVAVWGVWPVVATAVAVIAAKRLDLKKLLPPKARMLRALGWVVAAVAACVALSGNGTGAAGGSHFGLALAAALACYLKLTARSR